MPDWGRILRGRADFGSLDVHRERELVAELSAELDEIYREALARGADADEASRLALEELGDVEALLREIRGKDAPLAHRREELMTDRGVGLGDAREGSWLGDLLRDLSFGTRILSRRPGFAALAITTLALGIGSSTALFSVVNGILLRPLPYEESSRLVNVGMTWGRSLEPTVASVPDFMDWSERITTLEMLAASQTTSMVLSGEGEPERLWTQSISPDFLPLLGVQPQLGRGFRPDEHRRGVERVAILSHGLWQRRWGGDRSVIGKSFRAESTNRSIGQASFTVVGVLPAGFHGPAALELDEAEIWLPLLLDQEAYLGNRTSFTLRVMGRLEPGVTMDTATEEIAAIATARKAEFPEHARVGDTVVGIGIASLLDKTIGGTRRDLMILLGASGLLLLIACANIGSLLLARATERAREVALRVAIGARPGRIVRQLLGESLLLAAWGGVAGVGVGFGLAAAFRAFGPADFPRLEEVAVDPRVLAFALGLTLLTGLLFGLAPAVLSSRVDLAATLKDGLGRLTGGRGRVRLRGGLVVVETGLAMTLLIGAGLLVNSYLRLNYVDPGFVPENLLTTDIGLGASYVTEEQRAAFCRGVVARVRHIPGVQSASSIVDLPIGTVSWTPNVRVAGRDSADTWDSSAHAVGDDYFETMGIRLLRGRAFTPEDDAGHPQVAIVNQTMALQMWPGGSPLGERIVLSKAAGAPQLTVVGVVASVRQRGLGAPPARELYMPYQQKPWIGWMYVVIRTQASAAALAIPLSDALRELEPNLPFAGIETMESRIAQSLAAPRIRTVLLTGFALMALILAAGGLYGTMLYLTGQRTQEIGIRVALGARLPAVLGLVLGEGMTLLGIGMAVGVAAALLASKLLSGLVFGIEVTDFSTYALSALALAVVGLSACFIPAQRATKVDPMAALRHD